MTPAQREWGNANEDLKAALKSLGFHENLGDVISGYLGNPKAIRRMVSYLYNAHPTSEEVVIDEMLAIRAEIDAWRDRKESLEANERYNEVLNQGLQSDDAE